ncbi:hemerythrin domain-containing protein [Cohnella thailandensis]|uniref:Hemerythrin domain-containing protein n=1 Tax=Cohnella thailandensis TaxID=557557 RepID=A0A841T6M2_9BACL|nr:hemerythrin domain-containing protein [Cohnella thailandensis]MBB6636801.1 hemerythrin domain-containing protein [Cohnella thailandensis]MBP1973322.1 iron-sulfur cluster repair protein YtfE (RIC family) [Cohnella thailandensis]
MTVHVPYEPSAQELNHPLNRLNEAIDHLKEEHALLQEALQEVYEKACAIRQEEDLHLLNYKLRTLRFTVMEFKKVLSEHSKWEETELFPMAAWYFGNDMEVFTIMEHEHDQAERRIDAFLRLANEKPIPVGHADAMQMASQLLQAYAVLKNHFKEEEEILVAFADRSNSFGY